MKLSVEGSSLLVQLEVQTCLVCVLLQSHVCTDPFTLTDGSRMISRPGYTALVGMLASKDAGCTYALRLRASGKEIHWALARTATPLTTMHKPFGLTCDTKDKKLSVYEWNVRLGERESVEFIQIRS